MQADRQAVYETGGQSVREIDRKRRRKRGREADRQAGMHIIDYGNSVTVPLIYEVHICL